MHPTGFILAMRVAQRDAESARPDAPVVPEKPRRSRRLPGTASARRVAATSLRNLAAWVEPCSDTEPCSPATS